MREELYKQHILDHATRPRNKGPLAGATHEGKGSNPSCGDSLALYLAIEGDRIARASFEGVGCAISQAGASLLTERLTGMPLAQADALRETDVYALLGIEVGPAREACALLAYRALKVALTSKP
jgi:nitrogen fixation NifU-like protein